MRIPQLPIWCYTDQLPAFYDSESATAIQQTAKLYASHRALIDDYNKFAKEVNIKIEEFINGINTDQEEFEKEITKIIHDYIVTIDTKIAHQDRVINDSIIYIKDNLQESIIKVVSEMKESGQIDEAILNSFNNLELRVSAIESSLSHGYDETSETLSLNFYEISTDVNTLYVNNVTSYSIDEPNEQVNIEEEEE